MIGENTISIRSRATQIALLAREGMSSREMAEQLGVRRQYICRLAKRFNIPLARSGSRNFSLYTSDRRARVVQELAREAGVSPATMVERMLRVVVDDGVEPARRRLGKLALPRGGRT